MPRESIITPLPLVEGTGGLSDSHRMLTSAPRAAAFRSAIASGGGEEEFFVRDTVFSLVLLALTGFAGEVVAAVFLGAEARGSIPNATDEEASPPDERAAEVVLMAFMAADVISRTRVACVFRTDAGWPASSTFVKSAAEPVMRPNAPSITNIQYSLCIACGMPESDRRLEFGKLPFYH